MTYATLREQEGVKQNFLVIMQPRRKLSTWTVYSGFIYQADWDGFPKPRTLEFNGVEMTEVATLAALTTASQWFWDSATDLVYFREPQSGDPDAGIVVIKYEIYASRADDYWYRVPTDNTTTQVYFEGLIKDNPEIKYTMTDSLFGYLPTLSSAIKLINSEHGLEKHVYDSSFNKGSIKIYHALGSSLSVSDIKLIYDGFMSDVNYSGAEVSIKTFDRIDELATEFRPDESAFYNTTDFSALDDSSSGNPVRYVYGRVQGFVPVNVDFVSDSPTTSDNRNWGVISEDTGLAEVSRTVGASSTTTQTNLSFTEGLNVGDSVFFDRVSGTDEYAIITAVSRSPANITHAALVSPMASGDAVKRGFVTRVDIVQDNVKYQALYSRDYTIDLNMNGGVSGFVFNTTLEANLSMPATLSPNDQVSCIVYGRVNDLTAGGPTFGANDTETNNITNPVMIIYDVMRNRLGITESSINLTQFATVRTETATEGLGLAIPKTAGGSFPTIKSLISNILETSLLRLFIDDDQKWSIVALGPFGSADDSFAQEEILDKLTYSFDYGDVISDSIVEYAYKERSDKINNQNEQVSRVTATSNTARYLHQVEKTHTVESLHMRSADAQQLADRLVYALGDRRGIISVSVPLRFIDSLIGDTISVSRPALPQFEFDSETNRTRSGVIIEVSKDSKKIKFDLDDQKGIQDNSGSW